MIRKATSSFVRTLAGAPATPRTIRFLIAAIAVHLRPVGGASTTSGCAIGWLGYGLRVAGDAAESTISHLPLIFCTSWSTPTVATTFAVFGSM